MTITDELRSEHRTFGMVLDQVEAVVFKVTTLQEAILLAEVIRGFLNKHGRQEDEILYPAMDHMLAEAGTLERRFQEHREMDLHLDKVATARTVEAARVRLRKTIQNIRSHFTNEERLVFPLVEQCLSAEALTRLEIASRAT